MVPKVIREKNSIKFGAKKICTMKLSEYTIESLKTLFSGDSELTPHLKGPEIVALFNLVGVRDVYSWELGGLPKKASRNNYVSATLKSLNGTKELVKLFELLVEERHFAKNPKLDRNGAVETINGILKSDGYVYVNVDGKWKISGKDLPDEIEVEIHFEEIQSQIVEQIKLAQFSIWVAVAWFTNKELMRALYEKKQSGLNVRLVIFDDEINNRDGVNFEKYFETKRVKPIGPYKNTMHHKFCIIDLKLVIHGSYNWTNKANWNKETISIEHGREIAEQFAHEFIKLAK